MKQFILFTCIAFLLCGCGFSEQNNSNEQQRNETTELPLKEVVIYAVGNTMADMKYDITEFRASPGQQVQVTLINQGTDETMQHNIVIIKQGTAENIATEAVKAGKEGNYVPSNDNVLAASGLAAPGDTVVMTFTAPELGSYEYICTYPGHFAKMRGTFIVD